MSVRVSINVFGRFEARADGEVVSFSSRKAQALLALLAVEPEGVSRDQAAVLPQPVQPAAARRMQRDALPLSPRGRTADGPPRTPGAHAPPCPS